MKIKLFLSFYALLFSSMVSAQTPPSGLPMADPSSVGMSAERLQRINAFTQRYIDDEMVAGTVTLVARKGKVVHFSAQGMKDVERNLPMTTDTIFRMASMTKPIASVALMMLYEEGYFQLDDPISDWLPEFKPLQKNLWAVFGAGNAPSA
jgi:CubicO group peptidase (beta-lactamase class C family)